MRVTVLTMCLAALAACTPADRDEVTRSAARSVVTRVVVERFPDIPVQPAIDCVIDNATAPELLGLASDSVLGPTQATTESVLRIASRPGTIQCLATQGVAPFISHSVARVDLRPDTAGIGLPIAARTP